MSELRGMYVSEMLFRKVTAMSELTHIDKNGSAVMVDIGSKSITDREATAAGCIYMSADCFDAVRKNTVKKGDVLSTAQIAGIMSAKHTAEVIPLCHILNLSYVGITFREDTAQCMIEAQCTVRCSGKTGVEMEALNGVSAALLTIYDMCKAIDKAMVITDIRVLKKTGGKSGTYIRTGEDRIEG